MTAIGQHGRRIADMKRRSIVPKLLMAVVLLICLAADGTPLQMVQRWQRDSEGRSRQFDFEQCYKYILDQDLVTPASIANDGKFKKIYSNYPL
jgi:hypothetical protein